MQRSFTVRGDPEHAGLHEGDDDLARWAAERGLLGCPGNETLTADLVRAYLAGGDHNTAERVVDVPSRMPAIPRHPTRSTTSSSPGGPLDELHMSVLTWAAVPLLVLVAIEDLRRRQIRNRHVLLLSVVAAVSVTAAYVDGDPAVVLRAVLGAVMAAVPLLVAALARPAQMGGGDVKIAAAVGALLGPVSPWFSSAAIAGALVLALTLAAARWSPPTASDEAHDRGDRGGHPMKNLHFGHCLIGVAVALALLVALEVETGTFGILAVALACPLMMFVMMRTMLGTRSASSPRDDHPVDHDQSR